MAYRPPESLKYETRGGTCYITMNRPQAMNALNLELQGALGDAVEEFEADSALYVAVITGEGGRAFSAGADLKEMTTFVGTDDDPRRTGARRFGSSMGAIEHCRKPIIAAIDGYAFAGGCADVRYPDRYASITVCYS